MSAALAIWLTRAMGLYLALGLLFALPFALAWAGRLDPAARTGTAGFRLLLLPGATLLWPYLAVRLLRRGSGAQS